MRSMAKLFCIRHCLLAVHATLGRQALKNDEPWVDEHLRKVFTFRVFYQQLAAAVRRFYYHADRLGMLVWQDMPSMCGMWEMPGATGEWYFDGCWVTNTCASPP